MIYSWLILSQCIDTIYTLFMTSKINLCHKHPNSATKLQVAEGKDNLVPVDRSKLKDYLSLLLFLVVYT